MEILLPPNFLTSLKHKYLLLDTNVFIDAVAKPLVFTKFFNGLKRNDTTLVTIDFVKYELLKESATPMKYKEREKHIADIVDTIIPFTPGV